MPLDIAKVTGSFTIVGTDIPAGKVILPDYPHPILTVTHGTDRTDGLPETTVSVSRETVDEDDQLVDQLSELAGEYDVRWNGWLLMESYGAAPLRRVLVRNGTAVVEAARLAWPDGTAV